MPRKKNKKSKPPNQPTPSAQPLKVNPRLRLWRWPIAAGMMFVLSLITLFALLMSLFNVIGLDDRLRNLLIDHVGTKMKKSFDSREISIILVDKNEHSETPFDAPSGKAKSSHRRYHAQLINALAGKARVVVFDMEFKTPDPEVDDEFAAAIEKAEKSDTRILVGGDLEEGDAEPTISAPLKAVLKDHWGTFDGRPSTGTSSTYFVRLGVKAPNQPQPDNETADQLLIPSLALKAVEQLRYSNQDLQAFFNPLTNLVLLRRGGANGSIVDAIPVDDDHYLAVDLVGKDAQGKRNLYHNVSAKQADLSEFINKIVVIGYQADDEQQVSESEQRYGAEIQANAISNMLLQTYIRRLSNSYEYLIIVLMIVIGAGLRLPGFGKLANYKLPVMLPGGIIDKSVEIPVTLLAVAVLDIFVAILVYKFARTVFNLPYQIVALFLSYLSIGTVRAKLGFK
jgi:CHASE2 domain-containing sensor protein